MPATAPRSAGKSDLIDLAQVASASLDALLAEATAKVRTQVTVEGRVVGRLFDREQRATHGLAWLATYVEAVRQLAAYVQRMHAAGRLGDIEELLVRIAMGEYLAQVFGGIPMSQGEIVRPADLGLAGAALAARMTAPLEAMIAAGNTAEHRARLMQLLRGQHEALAIDQGLDDTLEAIREEMRKFAESEVVPYAHQWHLNNQYIPLEIVTHMGELGVFGLTIPEAYGGMGLG